jgi:hypothetical protein
MRMLIAVDLLFWPVLLAAQANDPGLVYPCHLIPWSTLERTCVPPIRGPVAALRSVSSGSVDGPLPVLVLYNGFASTGIRREPSRWGGPGWLRRPVWLR